MLAASGVWETKLMETYDSYCLVPEGSDLGEALDHMFHFDGAIYHDGVVDHPVLSGAAAASAFNSMMRDGDFIRFNKCRVDRTEGGWLYRLNDGTPVIGISVGIEVLGPPILRALQQVMPGAVCCIRWGNMPPPTTRSEFLLAAESTSENAR